MRIHLKQYTEPIFATLATQRAQLATHPLLAAPDLPTTILHEFAFHQYSDSILWIPMLAQMKAKAIRSRRLRRAIEDNIAHEAGLGGISHVTLAVELMRSLGIRTLDAFPDRHVRALRDAVALRRVRRRWPSPRSRAGCSPPRRSCPICSPRSSPRSRGSAPTRATSASTSRSTPTSTPRGWRRPSTTSSSSTVPSASPRSSPAWPTRWPRRSRSPTRCGGGR